MAGLARATEAISKANEARNRSKMGEEETGHGRRIVVVVERLLRRMYARKKPGPLSPALKEFPGSVSGEGPRFLYRFLSLPSF